MAELIPEFDLDQIYWKAFAAQFSFRDILAKVEIARRQVRGLKADSLILLQGFDPLSTWVFILASWQEGLAVLPLGKGVERPNIPWTLCLSEIDGQLVREVRSETYRHECQLYILSSGSTGTPKAIGHTIEGLMSSARSTLAFYHVQAGDSWLLSLDPSHIGGFQILLRMWVGGGTVAYGGEPKYVAEALVVLKPDYLSLVPTQLFLLLDQDESKSQLQKCKAIMLGGAGVQPSLLERLKTLDLPISITYGSSETASQITGFPPGEFPEVSENVGKPLAHWIMESRAGDLYLQGPALYKGQFVGDSWEPRPEPFILPDRGRFLGDYVYVEGRRDQVFQVGGENVAPAEILASLESRYNLGDLLVLAKPDSKYGNIPLLVVRAQKEPDVSAIQAGFAALKPMKRPREIWWFESSDVTKISKAQIEPLLHHGKHPLKRLWKYEKI